MSKKEEIFKRLFDHRFNRLIIKWNQLERRPRDYGTGDELHPSEIHTIVAISENPDSHMAHLAKTVGVTRGAIMQLVKKLEKRGLIERFMKEHDNKKVFLKLSSSGEKAVEGHTAYHKGMYDDLFILIKKFGMKELELLEDVFIKVESHVDTYLEKS